MKGVDLSQFEFDFDLNWAAVFINADGTVYGRYGTQSASGADAYNSIESLEKAMSRVLELHKQYPGNAAKLAGKRPPAKPYKTALQMPALDQKEKLHGRTERNNCIHCHNIHDAQNRHAQDNGTFMQDLLWRYPLPDNAGFRIDPKDGRKVASVEAGSPAAKAGMQPGDAVMEAGGQAILSIADIQWVFHNSPNTATTVGLVVERDGKSLKKTLSLPAGWKRTDLSWRGSLWSVSPRIRTWAPLLKPEELKERGLAEDQRVMLVKWINQGTPGGQAMKDAGIREGDLIVGLDGKPLHDTGGHFHEHIKLNYKIGDELPLDLLRDGKEVRINVPLVE